MATMPHLKIAGTVTGRYNGTSPWRDSMLEAQREKHTAQMESIERQAIGTMTSRTLLALQPHLTLENYKTILQETYCAYYKIIQSDKILKERL